MAESGRGLGNTEFHYVGGQRAAPYLDACFDVVFVHGLTGDHEKTWKHDNGAYWPQWLASDFPQINVYAAGYDSSFFHNILEGGGPTLGDRASALLDRLLTRPTSGRPIFFIVHSLGGLIVKQLLRKSNDASTSRKKAVADSALGVAFIATPHLGAKLAKNILSILTMAVSKSVKDLDHQTEPLIDLAQWFSNWAGGKKVRVEAYYETRKVKGVLVVDKVTANPNVFGCDPVGMDADHIDITKIDARDHQLYLSIRDLVANLAQNGGGGTAHYGDAGSVDLRSELDAFTNFAPLDRRSLAEKLTAAGRDNEIGRAEIQKEKFARSLARRMAQPAAVDRYARLLSSIDTRFHRFVGRLINSNADALSIDRAIQSDVIDECLKAHDAGGELSSEGVVEGALYYLAGNCHVSWDNG